jgi:6-phosphogluconolactonase
VGRDSVHCRDPRLESSMKVKNSSRRYRKDSVPGIANIPIEGKDIDNIAENSAAESQPRSYKPLRMTERTLPLLFLFVLLSACGSSGSGTVQTSSTEFTYVINRNGTVSAFVVNQVLGTLRSLKGSPFPTGGMDSISATIDPLQRFLFVSNQGSGDVSVFQVASSGILKLVSGSPFVSGPGARSTAITPDLKFLYVANTLANSIAAFSVNIDSGALTPLAGSPFAIGPGSGPFSLAVNPMGTRLYVTASAINQILAFNIAPDGSLSALAGSPFSTGHNPSEIRINLLGVFLYTTNFDDDDIGGFSIDPATGTLAPLSGSPFAAGAGPFGAAIDPAGLFLYVTNRSDNTISAYSIISSTGILSSVAGSPFATGPSPADVAEDGAGRLLWVANETGDSVSGYRIDRSSGALSTLANSPFGVAAGSHPFGIATASF